MSRLVPIKTLPSVLITSFVLVLISFSGRSLLSQGHPLDYIQSTRPLKSGGSITTITRQGQTNSWMNSATNRRGLSNSALRETSFNQDFSDSSTSFYRQAQATGAPESAYPYPGGAGSTNVSGSRFDRDQQAELRFERAGLRDRSTGNLGNTTSNNSAGSQSRSAPPTTVPAQRQPPPERFAQLPGGGSSTRSSLSAAANGGASVSGPNYVNTNSNFAGFQGFQPNAIAANSVPALNTSARGFRTAQAGANCCCVPCAAQTPPPFRPFPNQATNIGFNPGFQVPQTPQVPNQGFQFQRGIGVPQFNGNGTPWWSPFLTGSGQYTPLLQFRNMPPGTYLGQGLIGQPTAYVDGQPFRNLIRYVAP